MKQYNNMYKGAKPKDEMTEVKEEKVTEVKDEVKEEPVEEVKDEVKEETAEEVKDEAEEIKDEVKEEKPAENIKYVAVVTNADANRAKKRMGRVYNCSRLNVRSGPSQMASVVEIINAGDMVEMLYEDNNFTKVLTKRGMSGYCMTEFLEEV